MPADGFQTPDQLRALAQRLADAADSYADRLRSEAANMTSDQIYPRLQEDQRLRGMANQLFFEASNHTISEALPGQTELDGTLTKAADKIKKFQRFENALEIVADLIALAGAVLAGKPGPVIAAIDEVAKDVAKADDAAA
jgi:hypothetical protein